MGGDLVGYDITIPCTLCEAPELGAKLVKWCKKFVFQREKGDEGYEHFQCRVHLIKAKTMATVIRDVAPKVGGHWSITSSNTHVKGSFNYVMKEDTLMEGPWTEEDFTNPPKLTRQLRTFLQHEMYPWQKQISEMIQVEDDRRIIMVWDEVGNIGKSVFAEYMEYLGRAFEVPPFRQMEDIMQFAFSFKDQKCYMVDMPRAMKKDKLGEFYAGLECLKNGRLYDKRHVGKARRMDRPQIVVFTNVLPEWTMMSQDRWTVFAMQADRSLREYQWQQTDILVGGETLVAT